MEKGTLSLPRTIEGATKRYMQVYEDNFVGSVSDMYRLRDLAEKFIYRLRKVAPRFYEEKLAQLVNQAASTLLTFNTTVTEDMKKFHETHAYFLLVLQDLRQSQPAGEVNFHNEKNRFEERARLIKRQAQLKQMIEDMEAAEFDIDDIGDDESEYDKHFQKLELLQKECLDINMKLAYIEGEQIEETPDFKLKVVPNSILNRLTKDQLQHLEEQMLNFYRQNNNKKTAIYVDKSIIDGMIENLGIEKGKFQFEELRHISKDALDAYKSYYREKEQALRDEYYKNLLDCDKLRPKEGLILDDPECLPDHVKRQLDKNFDTFQDETQNLLKEFSDKQDLEETYPDDQLEDSDDEVKRTDAETIITALKAKGVQFARVVEAPRDDYVSDEDEMDII